MVSFLVNKLALPELTPADEVTGRLYYAVSACVDIVQTIAKVARSIFISLLVAISRQESTFLNKAYSLSWNDVGFSIQMTGYSLLGIFNPRQAWLKKFDAHISSVFSKVELGCFLFTEMDSLNSTAERSVVVAQLLESGVRYMGSCTRVGTTNLISSLSPRNNTTFIEILRRGAITSANSANEEIELIADGFNNK